MSKNMIQPLLARAVTLHGQNSVSTSFQVSIFPLFLMILIVPFSYNIWILPNFQSSFFDTFAYRSWLYQNSSFPYILSIFMITIFPTIPLKSIDTPSNFQNRLKIFWKLFWWNLFWFVYIQNVTRPVTRQIQDWLIFLV